MALSIAETTFITSSKSNLAAVDVYGKPVPTTPVNGGSKKQSILDKVTAEHTGNIIGEMYGNSLKKLNESLMSGNYDKMMEGIKGVFNGKEMLKGIKEGVVTDVLNNVGFGKDAQAMARVLLAGGDTNTMLSGLGKINPTLSVLTNGVSTIVNGDFKSATGLVGMMTALTGNSELMKIMNLEPHILVFKNMLQIASAFRVPELIDSIINRAKKDGVSAEMIMPIASEAFIENSDIESINKVAELVGEEYFQLSDPKSIIKLLANYKTRHGDFPTEEECAEFEKLLDKIKSRWYVYNRNGEEILNLDMFVNISPHTHYVLWKQEKLRIALLCGSKFKVRSIQSHINEKRPWTRWTAHTNKPKPPVRVSLQYT